MNTKQIIDAHVLPLIFKHFGKKSLEESESKLYQCQKKIIKSEYDLEWEEFMLLLDPTGWLDYKLQMEEFRKDKRMKII